MKRKELKNYIRTEIINELSEDISADKAAQDAKKVAIDKEIIALQKKKTELSRGPQSPLAEEGIEEMARPRKTIKIDDQEKFNEALDLYGTDTIEGKILQLVDEAGEDGTTQEDMATKMNTSTSILNPRIREFELAKVFIRPEREIEPLDLEEPEIEEPEIEEPEEDEYEKSEKAKQEEFPVEFEPSTADIKSTEKEFGGEYGEKLSPEDEERYQKIRKGIEAKIKRLADMSSSERAKSPDLQTLKTLINKEDVKKLFKDKGVSLKDLVGDVIG
jgi:hypothetical protein